MVRSGLLAVKRKWFPRSSVMILAYHTLDTPTFLREVLGITFQIQDFISQMDYLAKHHPVLSMGELLSGLQGSASLPSNAVVITFDDGYEDISRVAAPILTQKQLPATVFITPGSIGTQRSIWTNRLYGIIAKSRVQRLKITFPDGQEGVYLFSDRISRQRSALQLSGRLKRIPEDDREQLLHQIAEWMETDPEDDPHAMLPMLDWDQVRALHQSGFTIGSHTCSHPILSRCSMERQWEELHQSKRLIEENIGDECQVLAYPNGGPDDYTTQTMAMACQAGYKAAFRFYAGDVYAGIDRYNIPRHPLFDIPIDSFAWAVS